MKKFTPVDILDSIDADCKAQGLPPLSWLVTDIPGRPNATPEQREQVFAAVKAGLYTLVGIDPGPFGGH